MRGKSCKLSRFHSALSLKVDYFVMSTHKWLGNIKTCGIIRFGDEALPPNPPAISFGWDLPAEGHDDEQPSIEETK